MDLETLRIFPKGFPKRRAFSKPTVILMKRNLRVAELLSGRIIVIFLSCRNFYLRIVTDRYAHENDWMMDEGGRVAML